MKKAFINAIVFSLLFVAAFGLLPPHNSLAAQTGAVNLNFEEGSLGQVPTGWYYAGSVPGYTARLTDQNPFSGRMCAVLQRDGAAAQNEFGHLSQGFNADLFRGKRVRFRAAVRAEVTGVRNQAQLWLRVDRPNQIVGFFDNMNNRPILTSQWGYYEIIGDVAEDATQIYLGLILSGAGKAWIDDGSFEIFGDAPIVEPPRPLTARGLENVTAFTRLLGYIRHFHPSDEAAGTDWDNLAIEGMRAVENAGTAAELAGKIETFFRPIAPTLSVFPVGGSPVIVRATPPPNPSGSVRVVMWSHLGFGTGNPQNIYHSERISSDAPDGKFPESLAAYQEPYRAELGGGPGNREARHPGFGDRRDSPRKDRGT